MRSPTKAVDEMYEEERKQRIYREMAERDRARDAIIMGRDGRIDRVEPPLPCSCCRYQLIQRDGELRGRWMLISQFEYGRTHPPVREES